MKDRRFSTILLYVILIIGICGMLYPAVSSWINKMNLGYAVAGYTEQVADTSQETLDAIWNSAAEYNTQLAQEPFGFNLSGEELADYNSRLDPVGNGMMGYLVIDKIDVNLPIYHGVSDSVLSAGIGHIPGSSLPVGGESTHCVLSGHTGLPSAKMLTSLTQMEIGDTFCICVLNSRLTYEVDQIETVLPDQVDSLAITQGQDYVTLVTCTPYGINTHRPLVRGHRVENAADAGSSGSNAVAWIDTIEILLFIAGIVLAAFIIKRIIHRKKTRGQSRNELKETR